MPVKPDSAIAIADQQDHRVEQPAHEAQARRALAREPGPLRPPRARRAPRNARSTQRRRATNATRIDDARVDPGARASDVTSWPRRTWPRSAILLRRPRHAARRSSRRRRTCARRCASARASTSARRRAEAAIRAEIAYYRAHLHEGRDADVAARPARCAAPRRWARTARLARRAPSLDALLASLRFYAYPDAAPALSALRAAGIRLVVVSNWDWSLHERLAETGLAPLVDGAIASAEVGSAKPDARDLRARRWSSRARRARRLARRRHAGGRRRGRPGGRAARRS